MEQTLAYYAQHPERLNEETLEQLRYYVEQYPYFHAARLLMLQNLFVLHDASFGEEMRNNAPLIPERSVLFEMVEGDHYKFQPVPRATKTEADVPENADRTQSLIDQYLDTTPDDEELSAPKPGHRKPTVVDATTDYAAYLLQMDDARPEEEDGRQSERSSSLINDFIGSNNGRIVLPATPDEPEENSTPSAEETENKPTDNEEDFFTETLAKIYIQQGRYEKAIEIIRKLYTNYPKKNRYFADQLRFLEKLVINNQSNL